MTRSELNARLAAHSSRTKLAIIIFGGVMFAFMAAIFILPTRNSGVVAQLTCFALLTVGTGVGIGLWRLTAHRLAKRQQLFCPACGHILLGIPAEPLLMQTGRCHYCGSQVISDDTPQA